MTLITRRTGRTPSPAYLFVAGWLLLALLLPVYAPWLNTSYAAAQAGHRHIYLGGVDFDHHVAPPVPHAHPDPQGKAAPATAETVKGVIILPDQNVAGQILPVATQFEHFPAGSAQNGLGTLSFPLTAAYHNVHLVFLSRPVPPPR